MMKSGALLREARRRAGLSQAALGRRVGRPQTQIARWERGAVLPSLETLREIVRACGLDGERPLVPQATLRTLHAYGGRFILVGALAAVLLGSPLLAVDMRLV